MRKIVAGVLVLALLCLYAPALAADVTPIYEWTEEEWSYNMENWTDEDCYEYIDWENSMYDDYDWEIYENYYEQLYLAMEDWTEEQFAFYENMYSAYYALYQQMWIIKEKEKNGFPYQAGLNVQVNGKFITFSGPRAVVNANGVTMIPADALAAALGADCSYSADTATITLRGNSVSFTSGTEISMASGYSYDYETYTYVQQYVAVTPYREDGALMVPLRAVSDAFGCTLIWLQNYELALLLDRDAIVSEIDKSFTMVNRFLSLASQETKTDDNTETTISASLEGMFYGESENTATTLSADMTLLQNGADMQLELDIDTDAENLKDVLEILYNLEYGSYYYYYGYGNSLEEYLSETLDMLTTYVDGEHGIIVKDGYIYTQSPLTALTGIAPNGKWIRSPLDEDSIDTDYSYAIAQELFGTYESVGAYIYDDYFPSSNSLYYDYYNYGYYYYDYYNLVMKEAAFAAAMVGDSRFTVAGNTYALTGSESDIIDTFAESYGEVDAGYLAYNYGIRGLAYTFSYTEENGALSEYSLDLSAVPYGSVPGTFTLSAAYSDSGFNMNVSFIGDVLGKIIFELSSSTTATAKTVQAPTDFVDEADLVGTPSYPDDADWDYYGWTDAA